MSTAVIAPRKERAGTRLRAAAQWAKGLSPGALILAAALVASLMVLVRRVGDPDFFWHLLAGQWMWDNHAIPRTEMLTYTAAGHPWTDHEYGLQFLYPLIINHLGGMVTLSLLFATILFTGFVLLVRRTRHRACNPVVLALAVVLGAGAAIPVWGPRPQMVDFAFSALELLWIERFLSGKARALYFLPLLTLVWANLHGGFVFAFFFLGIAAVAVAGNWLWQKNRADIARLRSLLIVGCASILTTFINPNGPSLFAYVWKTQFSAVQPDFIREWLSPNFHHLDMKAFELSLLLLLIGFLWRRPRLYDVLLAVGVGILALQSVRHIAIFVVAAMPLVAWQWSAAWEEISGHWRGIEERLHRIGHNTLVAASAGLLAVVTVATLLFCAHTLRGQAASTDDNFPVAAADWLDAHPNVGTRMFNEYSWGGYLAYRFYPQPNRRLFIYGEAELMGDPLMAAYAGINGLDPDWQTLLDQYGVDYIVYPTGQPFTSALSASPHWKLVYQDQVASIYVRSAGGATA